MAWRQRIPREMREQLDTVEISALLEYLARRLGFTVGKRELRTKFKDGRYDRSVDERGQPIGSCARVSRRREDRPDGP